MECSGSGGRERGSPSRGASIGRLLLDKSKSTGTRMKELWGPWLHTNMESPQGIKF